MRCDKCAAGARGRRARGGRRNLRAARSALLDCFAVIIIDLVMEDNSAQNAAMDPARRHLSLRPPDGDSVRYV